MSVAADSGRGAPAAGGAPGPPAAGRQDWPSRPRRDRPRWTPAVFAIRAPIPRRSRWILNSLSLLTPLGVWLALTATHAVDGRFLPSPLAVWNAGSEMARSSDCARNQSWLEKLLGIQSCLLSDTVWTTQRIVLGFALALMVSVPLGIVMGTFRAGQALLEPMIALLRYLPAVAFTFLVIIWLGIEEQPKIAVIFLGTVFFNTVMTADAVRNVPMTLIDVSYTLGARRGEVLRKVIIPHALPSMVDAARVNIAAAWNLVVVAEVLGAAAGLGYRINKAQRGPQMDKVFAILVVIALTGVVLDVALRLIRERVGRWVA